MLSIEGLSRRYGSKTAVDNVSLNIENGRFVGIIGRSGAGKSTLLRMINRLEQPSSGRIRFKDFEVTRLSGAALAAWRSRCAMIFQQFNLVGRLDVLTNVLIGRLTTPLHCDPFCSCGRKKTSRLRSRRSNSLISLVSPRSAPTAFRAASNSASRSPGRSFRSRKSCSLTNRSRRLIHAMLAL